MQKGIRVAVLQGVCIFLAFGLGLGFAHSARAQSPNDWGKVRLPIVRVPPCSPIPGVAYEAIPVLYPSTDPPASAHPDLNLALRGYRLAPGNPWKGFVFYGGDADPYAPRLTDLFADRRAPTFANLYQVYDWDGSWPGSFWPITSPEVTMAGLAAAPGEILYLPGTFTPNEIYIGGYQALVLYAEENRLTLKYTREDNVIWGYTIHLEGICVEPSLLALYRASDANGRTFLPALRARQILGRARGNEAKIAIRDTGAFMDPRSYKDWWRDVPISGNIIRRWAWGEAWFQAHQRAIQGRFLAEP